LKEGKMNKSDRDLYWGEE